MLDALPLLGSLAAPPPDPIDEGRARAPADDGEELDAYSRAVVSVVESVGPAVVSIARRGGRARGPDGAGSGLLFAPDGYVLTNAHVVADAKSLEARLPSGARLPARVVGEDTATDLAVLRVEGASLPYVTIGKASKLRVGQLVVAIGNPFGLDATVSAGVVSALGRSMKSREGHPIEDVVQHTAPLNPGNSGGPLVDFKGRLVGVNTAIIAGAQGLSFAVPSDTALWVVPEILKHGRVRRARLGVQVRQRVLDRRLARAHGLTAEHAVEIMRLTEGGPAAKAGLREGDLVIGFQGRPVSSTNELFRRLAEDASGRVVTLRILRKGALETYVVVPSTA
ncbi:MAG TPA: trypsin-like peptidase domain-containing protein [Minicystis sp.]|nr:trypsin-like peptidase domain-containing protein [Minicystis sp.]